MNYYSSDNCGGTGSRYPFSVKPLNYDFSALEPYIDAKTMELHHNRHYKKYVETLNGILKDTPCCQRKSLCELLTQEFNIDCNIMTDLRNNAGGVFNHQFFFCGMMPNEKSCPNRESCLSKAINKAFGSFEGFKAKFKEEALKVFGSGYAALAADKNGLLKIVKTKNQDTVFACALCPIVAIDVWEHAYYLKYQNLRADYIEAWFSVIDWDRASRLYEESCRNLERSRQRL